MKRLMPGVAVVCVLGFVLGGCAGGSRAAEPAAAGSPDLVSAGAIFAQSPLLGEELTVLSEDESTQLRQQVELSGKGVKGAEIDPQQCRSMLEGSFRLENLYWNSVAARSSDSGVAAQLFLAPSGEAASDLLARLRELVQGCEQVSVTYNGSVARVDLQMLPVSGDGVLVFSQTVTRDGKSSVVNARFGVQGNALLALAVTDSALPDLDARLEKYSQAYFKRLAALYRS